VWSSLLFSYGDSISIYIVNLDFFFKRMMISSFKNHQTIFVCLDPLDVLNVAIFFLSTNETISLQNKRKGRGGGEREKKSPHGRHAT
jgi:hypothetical protein